MGGGNVPPTAKARLAYKPGESEEAHARRESRVASYQAKKKAEKAQIAQKWLDEHQGEPEYGKNISVPKVNPNDRDEHRMIEFTDTTDRNGGFYIVALNGRTSAGYGRFDKFTYQDRDEAIAKQKELYEKELKRIRKTAGR